MELQAEPPTLPRKTPGAPPAQDALDTCYEISKILDCGLDKETLSICIALIESGVNPEALAEVVKKLRTQAEQQKQSGAQGQQAAAPASAQ